MGPVIRWTAGIEVVHSETSFKGANNYKVLLQLIQSGVINVTYTTVPGMLGLKNQTEGGLAEPDVDFVLPVGFLVLEEGETTAAINITILEVKLSRVFHTL